MDDNQRKIAQQLLQNKIIVQSWGITNIRLMERGICFDVCGLKYKGTIVINNRENECLIKIGSRQIATTIFDIVDILDGEIEVTNNYAGDLKKWLLNRK